MFADIKHLPWGCIVTVFYREVTLYKTTQGRPRHNPENWIHSSGTEVQQEALQRLVGFVYKADLDSAFI